MSDAAARRMETALAGLVSRVIDTLPGAAHSAARHYFDLVAPDDMVGRDAADLAGMISSHVALAQTRPQGTARVRAVAPTQPRDGWHSAHTIIQVVTDDMPFLVDSVSAELTRMHRGIHLVIHPIYLVTRDTAGALVDVAGVIAGDVVPEGYAAESWMCFEVDRETDDSDLRAIETSLQRVLGDVRDAVDDWPRMRAKAVELAAMLENDPPCSATVEQRSEASAFLRWLADNHFTFTGFSEYTYGDSVSSVPGTGLGVLREGAEPGERVHHGTGSSDLMVVAKGGIRSTVHRPAYVDHVSIHRCDDSGRVVGEYRFVGLYSSSAYTASVFSMPLVARKAERVVADLGLGVESHSGKDLIQFLETYPRDQLFQIGVEELEATARGVLQLQERRQVRAFVRTDALGRFASVLVYFPRDRYTTDARVAMEGILRETFGAQDIDYTARLTESVLARLHFDVRIPDGHTPPTIDLPALEAALARATRVWDDDLSDALAAAIGEEAGVPSTRRWSAAFPESFKETVPAHVAVEHIRELERLESGEHGQIAVAMTPEGSVRRFTIYRTGQPITLSSVLPMLHDLGIEVIDERAYAIAGTVPMWLYDFGIGFDETAAPEVATLPRRFCEAFLDAWHGRSESDGFNALVVHGGLSSRNVAVIRAYAAYLRQAGTPFSQGYLQQVLRGNVAIVRLVLSLFRARFDPDFTADRGEAEITVTEQINAALESVSSLDQDRILRAAVSLVRATIRTNVFQGEGDGYRPVMAFKLDPRRVPDLPLPLPMFEVWVYAPRVEGIHLRFAQVARGGLRWSDRLEDFRTEVLGLVKAQMVKNTVIVPSGAKGGFVVKRGPEPSDRDAWLAEGIACYQMFIGGLLDVTDNLVEGEIVAPVDVVRHDADDPYLVVAADKGTATFSDIANKISLDRGFWLGDAFASGGSIGYDHKAMGITARGAWESVKRHFLELGVDCQSEDFTAVGVGDMSGDVFGNGMLLSRHTRLLAAFDHRHIFLDPNPDAARSFEERSRLFALPRSSWDDYDKSLISAGGGVFPRSAKSIPVSDEVRTALDIRSDETSMTPADLMSHILRARVGLLWNGGIGTYVKSAGETNAQVGDKANDALRIDGAQLRCSVVGEGGNLGMTQLGRIEAAAAGVRLNTDAVDNSAGVDTSDHEVNIKILLNQVVARGQLPEDARHELLARMTDEVGLQVLRDNYLQNTLLEQSREHAPAMLRVHERVMRDLEVKGLLNRGVEYLPTDHAIDALHAAGRGLTSPELAVLMAYVKIDLKRVDPQETLYDESWCDELLRGYFPAELGQKYTAEMATHPLRREIIATVLTNDMVNRGGITFAFRVAEETGADRAQITRAYRVAREVFDFEGLWNDIEALDRSVSTACQVELYWEARRLLDRATRWFLQARSGRLDVHGEIDRFREPLAALRPSVAGLLKGVERQRFDDHVARLVEMGAPIGLAERTAALLDEFSLLDIVDISVRAGADTGKVAELYFMLSEHFEVDRLLHHITSLPRDDRWASNARSAFRSDLYAALAGLTSNVVGMTPADIPAAERISQWEGNLSEGIGRARVTLGEIATGEQVDLATLSVALRAIRTVVGQ